MSRPNVLALSYLFPNRAQPGYGVFVLHRLQAVRQLCDIKVIAPVQWYPFIRRLRGALWGPGIPERERIGDLDVFHPRFAVIPRYLKWIDAISYFLSTQRVVRRLRSRESFAYDLIDVHWTYPDIVAGYLLARRAGKKCIVTVRGHEALYDTERSLRRWLVSRYLRRADFVIALSEELREKVIRLGVDPDRVRVVLNGVDLSRFGYMDRDECRDRLGLDRRKKILISVGRFTAGKGHQELVRMMPALSALMDAELHIIGGVNAEGDIGHALRKMIADLKLTNVHLIDKVPQDQLALWYGAADLFCLATASEGCPNVVLEALACGTPVVVTDVGAVREIVQNGLNGIAIPKDQLTALAEHVGAALAKNWDRRQIAARMQGWGWSACAEQVMDVYRTVLG